MAETLTEKLGTVISPKNTAFDDSIQWITEAEALILDKMIYKSFVRKKELKEGDSKKFFYRITGVCPYVPLHRNGREVLAAANQNLIEFTVDRYYRNEMVVSKRRESGQEIEEEVNKPVARNVYDEKSGTWVLADSDTGFKMDSRMFQELFKRDTE